MLDIPAPFVNWNLQCECGKLADEYHLTCKHGGGPVWQHDEIVNAWSTCLHELKRFITRKNLDIVTLEMRIDQTYLCTTLGVAMTLM